MKEYYYAYLKKYLTDCEDSRKDDDDFIRDRADYAASVFEGEMKAGTFDPGEVAIWERAFTVNSSSNRLSPIGLRYIVGLSIFRPDLYYKDTTFS